MNKGVTLLEVLVSISIFAIITAVVMYNHAAFDANVLVTNLAYEVALTVKQAQSYGLSVRKEVGFSGPYGIYFDINKSKKIIIFADLNKNHQYNGPGTNCGVGTDIECREVVEIRGDVEITSIEVDGMFPEATSIIFQRPDPIAHIYEFDDDPNLERSTARITISSKRGKVKVISVDRSGQISVQ